MMDFDILRTSAMQGIGQPATLTSHYQGYQGPISLSYACRGYKWFLAGEKKIYNNFSHLLILDKSDQNLFKIWSRQYLHYSVKS